MLAFLLSELYATSLFRLLLCRDMSYLSACQITPGCTRLRPDEPRPGAIRIENDA